MKNFLKSFKLFILLIVMSFSLITLGGCFDNDNDDNQNNNQTENTESGNGSFGDFDNM